MGKKKNHYANKKLKWIRPLKSREIDKMRDMKNENSVVFQQTENSIIVRKSGLEIRQWSMALRNPKMRRITWLNNHKKCAPSEDRTHDLQIALSHFDYETDALPTALRSHAIGLLFYGKNRTHFTKLSNLHRSTWLWIVPKRDSSLSY